MKSSEYPISNKEYPISNGKAAFTLVIDHSMCNVGYSLKLLTSAQPAEWE
jgi:hypothetical protein